MRLPKIDRFLSADAILQPVIAKARQLGALARLCDDFLPPDLACQVRPAGLKDGRLAVLAAHAAAAAKLKLLSESLSDYLRKQGWEVNSVSVRVQPGAIRKTVVASHKQAWLSAVALKELKALHQKMPESPARRALEALLKHHRTRS